MNSIPIDALDEYHRRSFLKKSNEAFVELKSDRQAWIQEIEERNAWEVTLNDGLEDD